MTDHKPLEYLFKKDHAIPSGTSTRIARWAIELMSYDYSITYIRGSQIAHADALSRLRFYDDEQQISEESLISETINSVNFESSILDKDKVINELTVDPFIQRIKSRIVSGNWSKCTQTEQPFKSHSQTLTIENGMIFTGTRLFIPSRLRQAVFDACHGDNHSGIQSTINRIKLSSWWPGMDDDIERMTRRCLVCCKLRPRTLKTVDQWKSTTEPFERIHMDWAYFKEVQRNILIIVDAATGWIEAFPFQKRETVNVIRCLRTVFTRFGIPEVVVSDNAAEFTADYLNEWLKNQGIRKMESPIYFPRSNGLAERAVQTVKTALKGWKEFGTHTEFNAFLQRILFHHRISSFSKGLSPAELVFGRKLRVPIVSRFQQGESVWFQPTKDVAKPATYVMTKGTNTSWILDDKRLTLVSNNQIAPTEWTEEEENQEESVSETEQIVPENQEERVSETEQIVPDPYTLRRSIRSKSTPLRYGYE